MQICYRPLFVVGSPQSSRVAESMAAVDIAAAVAAAMKAEKTIAEKSGAASAAPVTAKTENPSEPPVSAKQTDDGAENKLQSTTEGASESGSSGPARKKRRAKPASKAGSNWKKLKATLDVEATTSPTRRPRFKKRKAVEKRPRTENEKESTAGSSSKPVDASKTTPSADGKMHSAFARTAVALAGGELTRVVALDCEMVEVAGGFDALARASVVNVRGDVVLDTFVVVRTPVADYRTAHSGVTAPDIAPGAPRAAELADVRAAVGDMLRGRILVGHALRNDLRVLGMSHPAPLTRDTSVYFRRRGGRPQKLAALVAAKLGVDEFQKGSHDSAEDARAALALYKKFAKEWEASLRERTANSRRGRQRFVPRAAASNS